jgi:hypothetical protein
MGIFVEKEG